MARNSRLWSLIVLFAAACSAQAANVYLYVGPTGQTLYGRVEETAGNFVAFALVEGTGGAHVGGVIHYTIIANDSTDYQTRAGTVAFSAVNKAGTETGAVGTAAETVAVSTGTLTNTFTVDTSPRMAF